MRFFIAIATLLALAAASPLDVDHDVVEVGQAGDDAAQGRVFFATTTTTTVYTVSSTRVFTSTSYPSCFSTTDGSVTACSQGGISGRRKRAFDLLQVSLNGKETTMGDLINPSKVVEKRDVKEVEGREEPEPQYEEQRIVGLESMCNFGARSGDLAERFITYLTTTTVGSVTSTTSTTTDTANTQTILIKQDGAACIDTALFTSNSVTAC